MSLKSSLPQLTNSVSRALIPDTRLTTRHSVSAMIFGWNSSRTREHSTVRPFQVEPQRALNLAIGKVVSMHK